MEKPLLETATLHIDDRGFVYCALDDLGPKNIKRTYVVENHEAGRIRAWHGHKKAMTGIHVIHGTAKVAALKLTTNGTAGATEEIVKHTLSSRKPQIFWIPPGWYNGWMSLEPNTKILVYSTLTFDEVKLDDERWPLKGYENVFEVTNR